MAPSYPLIADVANSAKSAKKPGFADELLTISALGIYCASPFAAIILLTRFGDGEGVDDDPFFCRCRNFSLFAFFDFRTGAGADQKRLFSLAGMRDGRCVPKGVSAPSRSPSLPGPCIGGTSHATGQCACPVNTHLDDASGSCLADVIPPIPQAPKPALNIVCNGGQLSGGACSCPAAFKLRPAADDIGAGGTCVRTDAENCLGGEMTVSGTCLCDRHVIMSGEEYALEYVNGKCVPQRCPIAALNKGRCVATAAKSPNSQPEESVKPGPPKLASEGEDHPHHCGRGMIRTRSGCVPARRRYPGFYESGPAGVPGYYRSYQFPGYSSSSPPN